MSKIAVDVKKQFGDRLELFSVEPDGYVDRQTGEFIHNKIFGTDLFGFKAVIGWRKKDKDGKTSQGQDEVIVGSDDPAVLPYSELIDGFIEIPELWFESRSGLSQKGKAYQIDTFTADQILPVSTKASSSKSTATASASESEKETASRFSAAGKA